MGASTIENNIRTYLTVNQKLEKVSGNMRNKELDQGRPWVVDREGLEPSTNALKGRCSTIELSIRKKLPIAHAIGRKIHQCPSANNLNFILFYLRLMNLWRFFFRARAFPRTHGGRMDDTTHTNTKIILRTQNNVLHGHLSNDAKIQC